MIYPIVKEGDPVLRSRAQEVPIADIKTKAIQKLIADMVETMYHANGVGIAAPQIGVSLRIFIAESSDGPIALINPVFRSVSWKKVAGEEGCLSVPGKYDRVLRAKSVTIDAYTAHGDAINFTAEAFFARILQHELDHLDGLLYVDRVREQRSS